MNDVVTSIAVTEARSSCKDEPDIAERLKKAMRACHGHWMVTAETEQFRAAVAAAALESNEEEKDRILRSGRKATEINNAMAAAAAGVPVDLISVLSDADEDLLPLMRLWKETNTR